MILTIINIFNESIRIQGYQSAKRVNDMAIFTRHVFVKSRREMWFFSFTGGYIHVTYVYVSAMSQHDVDIM